MEVQISKEHSLQGKQQRVWVTRPGNSGLVSRWDFMPRCKVTVWAVRRKLGREEKVYTRWTSWFATWNSVMFIIARRSSPDANTMFQDPPTSRRVEITKPLFLLDYTVPEIQSQQHKQSHSGKVILQVTVSAPPYGGVLLSRTLCPRVARSSLTKSKHLHDTRAENVSSVSGSLSCFQRLQISHQPSLREGPI